MSIYVIHLSDNRQFAVAEEKLQEAKADLAQYSEDGYLDIDGPYDGFEITAQPIVDPQEYS